MNAKEIFQGWCKIWQNFYVFSNHNEIHSIDPNDPASFFDWFDRLLLLETVVYNPCLRVYWLQSKLIWVHGVSAGIEPGTCGYPQIFNVLRSSPLSYGEGPKLGTYSAWGLSSVLVINKHLSHHISPKNLQDPHYHCLEYLCLTFAEGPGDVIV